MKLRAFVLAVDDAMSPVTSRIERVMRWMMAKWWRMVAIGAAEVAVIGVVTWRT